MLPDSSPLPLLVPLLTHLTQPPSLPQLLQPAATSSSHSVTNRSALPNNRSDDSAAEQLLLDTGHHSIDSGALFHLSTSPSLGSVTPRFTALPPPHSRSPEKLFSDVFAERDEKSGKLCCPTVSSCCCCSPPLLRRRSDCGGAAEQPVVAKVRMRSAAYLPAIDVTHPREAR